MAYGFFWRFKGSNRQPVAPKATHPKPVEQLDRATGKIVATYPSQSEAERILNISAGNISSVCHGKRESAYGYFWRFKGSDTLANVEVPSPPATPPIRGEQLGASVWIKAEEAMVAVPNEQQPMVAYSGAGADGSVQFAVKIEPEAPHAPAFEDGVVPSHPACAQLVSETTFLDFLRTTSGNMANLADADDADFDLSDLWDVEEITNGERTTKHAPLQEQQRVNVAFTDGGGEAAPRSLLPWQHLLMQQQQDPRGAAVPAFGPLSSLSCGTSWGGRVVVAPNAAFSQAAKHAACTSSKRKVGSPLFLLISEAVISFAVMLCNSALS
jgi:hypothetical protein